MVVYVISELGSLGMIRIGSLRDGRITYLAFHRLRLLGCFFVLPKHSVAFQPVSAAIQNLRKG